MMASDSKLMLRQHLDNGEQRVFEIALSHGHHTLIYGIYADGACSGQNDELDVRQWDEIRSECAALLSTQQRCVFMESRTLPTLVQCHNVGLPGNTDQEWMLLKSSETSGDGIKIQLRPSEPIRLGPFHLTFVAAKDVLEPPIFNFYRLAPGIGSRDHHDATDSPAIQEQPVGPEMPLNLTSYSATSNEHPREHVLDQGPVDECQDQAGPLSVRHEQSEPSMDILDPNSVADARTHAQLDNAPELSPNHAAVETAEESGGKVCHDLDTQDSMLPCIQIKTPELSLNDTRDTAQGAGARCVSEGSHSPPQTSPPSERKRKRSISPPSKPQSPAIGRHSSSPEAADGVMRQHEVSQTAHPPPETLAASEQKRKRKRSVSPLSTCQSPIKHMQTNSLGASDGGVPENEETEVADSPPRITPPSVREKKRKVARFSLSETPIKSRRPRELSALKASRRPTGGQTLRVLFASSSTIDESSAHVRFLREQHVEIVKDVRKCTVLCTGVGGFKKTSKFIMAVLFGVPITTDEWVLQSVQAGKLLAVDEFLARDAAREAEWGFNLRESVLRAEKGYKAFADWTIVFTAAAKKLAGKTAFDELKSLALAAGAQNVFAADAKKIADQGNKASRVLIIAGSKDPAVSKLGDLRCFNQEIIGMSILRGVLDTSSDEFLQK